MEGPGRKLQNGRYLEGLSRKLQFFMRKSKPKDLLGVWYSEGPSRKLKFFMRKPKTKNVQMSQEISTKVQISPGIPNSVVL